MKEKETDLEEISAAVTRYYDSLTDEEIAEDRAWGEFAASQDSTVKCSSRRLAKE
jgi:hypothetical protein